MTAPRPRIGFASIALGLTRERLAFWLAAGSGLVLSEGVWRLDRPAGVAGNRGPAPAPVPEPLARAAIAGGARVERDADLFSTSARAA